MTGFEDTAGRLDQAEADFFRAEAIEEIRRLPGLRYAWTDVDRTRCTVVCNGQQIGEIVPQRPGQQLTGWTAYARGDLLPAEFHTARAAAAAVARSLGLEPEA